MTAHRSNSTSAISAKSRATLVDTESDLIDTKEVNFEACYEVLPYLPSKNNLVNHLLEMFCIKWLNMFTNGSQIDSNTSAWPSPWILPVHVVSNRQDKDRHQITKVAKCTIDTGNMQGNIVSRDFVENVLEFPFTSFEKLTGEEQKGGTSITGDLHTPLGAINLTWHYSSSTRVFRNMRFLISPVPHCDMIIGAQAIQREKILSVPCLMGGSNLDFIRDKEEQRQTPEAKEKAKEKTQLQIIQHKVNETMRQKVLEEGLTKSDPLYVAFQKESKVVGWILELHKFPPHELGDASDEETAVWDNIKQHYPKISKNLSQTLKEKLQALSLDLGYKKEVRNPWNEPAPADYWDDDIDYEELLNPSK